MDISLLGWPLKLSIYYNWISISKELDILERVWTFVRIQTLTLTSPFKNGTDTGKNVSCGYAKGPELLGHRANVVKVSDTWRGKGRQWQDSIWHDENSGFYSEIREVSREFSVRKFWSNPWKQSRKMAKRHLCPAPCAPFTSPCKSLMTCYLQPSCMNRPQSSVSMPFFGYICGVSDRQWRLLPGTAQPLWRQVTYRNSSLFTNKHP